MDSSQVAPVCRLTLGAGVGPIPTGLLLDAEDLVALVEQLVPSRRASSVGSCCWQSGDRCVGVVRAFAHESVSDAAGVVIPSTL